MISICIPTYEMYGRGVEYLKHSFDIIKNQTMKSFEVVVSDHSINDDIVELCDEYSSTFDIVYIRNDCNRGNSSSNINTAIQSSTYDIIKVLFQDDYFFNNKSLENIYSLFMSSPCDWLLSRSTHTTNGISFYRDFTPVYHNDIHLGNNTISSPSVLTFSKQSGILFDDRLIWLMDVEVYKHLYELCGEPVISPTVDVVNRIWDNQVSNNVSTDIKNVELVYCEQKWSLK